VMRSRPPPSPPPPPAARPPPRGPPRRHGRGRGSPRPAPGRRGRPPRPRPRIPPSPVRKSDSRSCSSASLPPSRPIPRGIPHPRRGRAAGPIPAVPAGLSSPRPLGSLAHLADPGAVADGAVAAMAPRTARASALGSLTRHGAGARHRGRAGGIDLAGLAHLIPAGAVEKEVVIRGAPLPPHGDLHHLLARLDPRGAAPTIAVPIGGGGHDLRLAVPAVGGAEVGRH